MDYTSGPYTVTFPAGQTTATFDVPINDDDILEGDEEFILTIISSSLPIGITHGTPYEATVTIVDNESKYLVMHVSLFITINTKHVGYKQVDNLNINKQVLQILYHA